jgi:hypothetical protein
MTFVRRCCIILGIDHTRLPYRCAGWDFQLTDGFASVIDDVVAWNARNGLLSWWGIEEPGSRRYRPPPGP